MSYCFDEIVDRKPGSKSFSLKWQGCESNFTGYHIDKDESLPMWVADMDFRCPDEVVNAVVQRAKHGIYGYVSDDAAQNFFEAASSWINRRHGWSCPVDDMLFTPGVVPAIFSVVQAFTDTGDGVIIQSPVYYPFADSIKLNDRNLVNNQLIFHNNFYTIDFDHLEKLAGNPKNKLMILSNPHNPVGRVWTEEELFKIGKICVDNHVLLFSDEIHCDLVFKDYRFTTMGIFHSFAENMIIAHAPSKTFNMAGLQASVIIVPDPQKREKLAKHIAANKLPRSNVFGAIAGEAAYMHGDQYADEVTDYIYGNIQFAIDFIADIPEMRLIRPQGTYLVWIDFPGLNLTNEEVYHLILEKAKVIGDLGDWFGAGGEGFIRLNVACPRSILKEALLRIKQVIKNL